MNIQRLLGFLLLSTHYGFESHGLYLASAQNIISVGPFLEDDDLTLCIESLSSSDSDSNSRVDRSEFNIAVSQWTGGAIPPSTSQRSLPLQAVFIQYACVILRFCDSTRQVCCEEGSEQYIPLSDDSGLSVQKQSFFRLCAATDTAIFITTETFPSPLPSLSPSYVPSSLPSILSSSGPSLEASFGPSIEPSLVPSTSSSLDSSSSPSIIASITPSIAPTISQSEKPSSFPSVLSSSPPSIIPSTDPTVVASSIPSISPTFLSSVMPSSKPTVLSSIFPSISHIPTTSPSIVPSLGPSSSPSEFPSFLPTQTPTYFPSTKPSTTPTISSAPTRFGRLQITLTYGLRTAGFDADDILNAEDNTIAADLISSITAIILSIINQDTARSFLIEPPKPHFEGNSDNLKTKEGNDVDEPTNRMKVSRMYGIMHFIRKPSVPDVTNVYKPGTRRALRELVKYLPEVPAFHESIISDVCDPFKPSNECVIISTVVVVFTEEGEDRDEIRSRIVSGFNDALNDGTLLQALSN